jgi:hypothetical protein
MCFMWLLRIKIGYFSKLVSQLGFMVEKQCVSCEVGHWMFKYYVEEILASLYESYYVGLLVTLYIYTKDSQ